MGGYDITFGIDNDRPSVKTFGANHVQADFVCKDILNFTNKDLLDKLRNRKVDVVVGGPPCQGLSLSGARKYSDPRNKLFLSFVRIAKLLNPKAIVLENVPGIISLFGGKVRDDIINEFSAIGYSVKYDLLIAADYGVPQTRRRAIFVGLRTNDKEFDFPEPTHFPDGSLFGNHHISCEDAISDLPSLEEGGGEERQEYLVAAQNDYQRKMRKRSKAIFNHMGTNHTDKVRRIISLVPEGGNYKDLPERYKNSRNFHVAWTRYHSKKPAPTIDTGHRHHFHYRYNRVPTARENARLQSFPDSFIFYGNKTDQYRQIGNAVPPLMAKAIAKKLRAYL